MSARNWFERLLDSIADPALELIGLGKPDKRHPPSDAELCHRLVEGMGEASNVALAREILQRWEGMGDERRIAFLTTLAVELDPDPQAIAEAAAAFRPRDPAALRRLLQASEPPRQELLRRLNMAPGGTAALVGMRAYLLRKLRRLPQLQNVDADLQHLLASWFNRGFLRLERIDWNTPAAILEKLIRYEAVHPMRGWDDLHRRLGPDRRCFAFFHPALPQDPLIFVEVALTTGTSAAIAPLIDPSASESDPQHADTAVFYSINNVFAGLRGVSFGNFLIKQVVSELADEFPDIQTFVTLSPIPRLCQGLRELGDTEPLQRLLGERAQALCKADDRANPLDALDRLLQRPLEQAQRALIESSLLDLALYYLALMKRGQGAFDPVAHFHLSNGARLERINLNANLAPRGLQESWGCMVNYRYRDRELVANHEAYLNDGTIALSRELEQRLQRIQQLADGSDHAAA